MPTSPWFRLGSILGSISPACSWSFHTCTDPSSSVLPAASPWQRCLSLGSGSTQLLQIACVHVLIVLLRVCVCAVINVSAGLHPSPLRTPAGAAGHPFPTVSPAHKQLQKSCPHPHMDLPAVSCSPPPIRPAPPRLPDSICSGWRFVLIRTLCWPPLLSLAVQKGTNWQWANESPLSLSGAQLPPLRPGPPFSLPLLCLLSFIYFPSSCVFAPSHFLSASLPALPRSYRAFRPACVRLLLRGLAEPNAGDESSSHQADQARSPNEIRLSHPHNRE